MRRDSAAAGAEAQARHGAVARLLAALRARARFQPVPGNRVTLLVDGDAYFERLWATLDAARTQVWIEMYLIEPDAIGRATLAKLEAAARRGCDVILVYDHIGSSALGEGELAGLRAAGGRVLAFNPVWPWRSHGPALWRDHRKLVLIDGRLAFLGGRNIGLRYAGLRLGKDPLHDLQAEVEGPVVTDLGRLFAETLADLGEPAPALPARPAAAGDVSAQVLGANARRHRRGLQAALRRAVAAARDTCYLATPYPVPSRRFTRQLIRAARLGADVRVLIPRASDVRLVDYARSHIERRLLRHGIRVFRYRAPLHAKALVVDDALAVIGSFNMDAFTSTHNLELGLAIFDAGAARALRSRFLADLEASDELLAPPRSGPWRRLLEWCAFRLLSLRLIWPRPAPRHRN